MPCEIRGLTYYTTSEVVNVGDPPEGRWILKPLFPTVGKTIVYGAANDYKTWTILNLALAYGSQGSLFQEIPLEKYGRCLFISVEGDVYDTRDRITMFLQARADFDPGKVDVVFGHEPTYLNTPRGLEALDQALKELKPGLVVVDPFRSFIPGLNENDADRISTVQSALDEMIRRYRFSLVLIHHANKKGNIRGSTALDGWATSIIHFLVTRKQILEGMDTPCNVIALRQEKARNAARSDDILLVPVFSDQTKTAFYHVMNGVEQGDSLAAVDAAQRLLTWWKTIASVDPVLSLGFAIDAARLATTLSADKTKMGLLFLERRGLAKQTKILRPRGISGSPGTFNGWTIVPSTTDAIRAMLHLMKRLIAHEEPPQEDISVFEP